MSTVVGIGIGVVFGGDQTPTAPPGYILLVDDDGAYLVDDDGAYLVDEL